MDETVSALHAADVSLVDFKCHHAVEINLLTIARSEGVTTAKKSQNLLLLLLPGELRDVQILDEEFLVVSG